MLPSPAPRFYLVGATVAAAGAFLVLLRIARRRMPDRLPRGLVAVAVACLVAGAAVVGAGLWVDAEYNARMNATDFWYSVSLTMNGTGVVQVLLPAPSDARFYDALNVTNGSATLRLNHTSSETNVVLTAYGNASFQVHAHALTPPAGWSYTRVAPCNSGAGGTTCDTLIEMSARSADVRAFLHWEAWLGRTCESSGLQLEAWISTGPGIYPAQSIGVVC